ncbi:hypothetical protein GTW43_00805, partial [Streptomyces sp. SID5785]|uniref:hypothetical protein n=1 Tax=Streptomyces sp. SID5785 TaxID=2690309 RepID=UPI0013617307
VRLDPATGQARTVATVEGPTAYLGTDGAAVLLAGPDDGGARVAGPRSGTFLRVDTRTGAVSRHRVADLPSGVV